MTVSNKTATLEAVDKVDSLILLNVKGDSHPPLQSPMRVASSASQGFVYSLKRDRFQQNGHAFFSAQRFASTSIAPQSISAAWARVSTASEKLQP